MHGIVHQAKTAPNNIGTVAVTKNIALKSSDLFTCRDGPLKKLPESRCEGASLAFGNRATRRDGVEGVVKAKRSIFWCQYKGIGHAPPTLDVRRTERRQL